MIFHESYSSNYVNGIYNGPAADGQEDSETEKDNEDGSNDEDIANAELFVRLTDMVRKHYCGYLEKQLIENVQVWGANAKDQPGHTELTKDSTALQECCRLLEDRALKACMHARRYQRTMLKIIAEVRRSTQEFRLEEELRKLLINEKKNENLSRNSYSQKSTQTDESLLRIDNKHRSISDIETKTKNNPLSLTLEEKIEMFQQRLSQEAAAMVAATHNRPRSAKTRKHSSHNNLKNKSSIRRRQRPSAESKVSQRTEQFEKDHNAKLKPKCNNSILKQNITMKIENINRLPIVREVKSSPVAAKSTNNAFGFQISVDTDILAPDDEIAKELDQLFSEEKSELEELLSLSTNTAIDDPQVRTIVEEIQNTPLSQELKSTTLRESLHEAMTHSPAEIQRSPTLAKINSIPLMCASPIIDSHEHLNCQQHTLPQDSEQQQQQPIINLKHSLWPCELFMQRRCLTASLSRLIEEDFRWHDVMKWKFQTLFGEDSDDEFATCSPSIELDEILISSCIRRISPWIVKHLMKPMRDGLIANRFLFKKLAKRLAHSIVLENQYPDERLIKCAVEEYFCLHQAVLSLEDITDMPNLKAIDDT